jgi:GGDEF domain-containing protein/DNA-directed RNA polymerase subunit RPC12/RpoP
VILVVSRADAFLVQGGEPGDEARDFVRRVREDPVACVRPLYLTASLGDLHDSLSDGIAATPEEATDRAASLVVRSEEIHMRSLPEGRDFRMLGYLYLRDGGDLMPLKRPFSAEVYSYPVADCIAGEGYEGASWLRTLRDRGLLAQGSLVDRLRFCPRCECSHLNYVDVCPECRSLEIRKVEFLHCFTCGRVAPEEEFLKGEGMRCPFCGVRLRHLGSDYDHPLESYICAQCDARFVDPEVVVDCHCCGARSRPEDLAVRNIHGYRLTEKGRTSVRTGSMEDIYALLDHLNYVIPDYFLQLLDWLLILIRRYPDAGFGILGIRFDNLPELTDRLGRSRVTQMVDSVAERLRQLIRTTDVSTRTSRGGLWLLLPRTDREGCKILADRIEAMFDETVPGEAFRTRIVRFSAPGDLQSEEKAATLLAHLSGELED